MTPEEYKKIAARAVSEETEQIHLMIWCRYMETRFPELETIYHIPNEGKRSAMGGGKLKEMGLREGMPDLCLPISRCAFATLYIEMKKIGGKPTEKQIDKLEMLERYGNAVAICEGAEQAEKVIEAYCANDLEQLKKYILQKDFGDFEKLRGKLPKKKKKGISNVMLAAILQLAVTAAEISAYGTITGRSLILPLALLITWFITGMRIGTREA